MALRLNCLTLAEKFTNVTFSHKSCGTPKVNSMSDFVHRNLTLFIRVRCFKIDIETTLKNIQLKFWSSHTWTGWFGTWLEYFPFGNFIPTSGLKPPTSGLNSSYINADDWVTPGDAMIISSSDILWYQSVRVFLFDHPYLYLYIISIYNVRVCFSDVPMFHTSESMKSHKSNINHCSVAHPKIATIE